MKTTILLNLVVLLVTAASAPAATRLVPDEYATIQAAIDAAVDGDVVIFAPITYRGEGNRDIDFYGKAITVRSVDPNDPNIVAATIIDCDGTLEEKHRAFYFHSGEDCNSVVCGFTITNGYADRGGAIYCISSSPTLTNCIFVNNTAQYWEDYVSSTGFEDPEPMVNDGNGVHIMIPPPLPEWRGQGGGIYCRTSNPTLTNCTFSGNSADYGGGMGNWNSSPTLTNCTFSGNSAEGICGGMNNYNSSPTLTNCILWGNAGRDGMDESAQICGETPVVNYCCIQGWTGALGGTGNINADPLFLDATSGDYHLKSAGWRWHRQRKVWTWDEVTSPCIDAGNPGSPLGDELMSVPDDPNNEWGENLRINMGAYGGTAEASMAPPGWALLSDLSNDGIVNFVDLALQVEDWLTTANEQPGDLNHDGAVNMIDFSILADTWLKRKPFVVKITKPENGTYFYHYETIEIEADAWCFCCSVVKVEFFASGTKIGEDNYGSDGWKTNWEGDHALGSYNLTTKATNDNGATTVSLAVAIRIGGGGPP